MVAAGACRSGLDHRDALALGEDVGLVEGAQAYAVIKASSVMMAVD
jgi:hypothetical protein